MFQRVLYPVDPEIGGGAHDGLNTLRPQIETWGAELIVLSVLPSFATPLVAQFFPADAERRLKDEASDRLTALAREVLPGNARVTALVRSGIPYEEVLATAREHQADLIVIPGRSPSHDRRRMLGSNTFKVVTQAHCAVLVLPQQVLARD